MIPTFDFAHPVYDPNTQTPFYWRTEQSGDLVDAMLAYVMHTAWPEGYLAPTPEQLALVIRYLRYWINAPCWRDESGVLIQLRSDVEGLVGVKDVRKWIGRCLPIGLDPL